MKKVFISFVLVVLLVSMCGCAHRADNQENAADATAVRFPKLSNKTVTLADQSVHPLTFQESVYITDGVQLDKYAGTNEDLYTFNTSGTLVQYDSTRQVDATAPTIPASQAEAIAREHFKKTYGDFIDQYELESQKEIDGCYHLSFVKKYGEEAYIKGELCFAEVDYDGNVKHSHTLHVGRHDDFNTALLKGITEEKLRTYAEQQVSLENADLEFVELRNVWLIQNETYELTLSVLVRNEDGFDSLYEYTYSLE